MVPDTNQTYLLIGHVTKDLLPDNNFNIGGTVTFASTVAQRLGWQTTVVTAAAPDFEPPAFLAGVDWRILPSPETSTFRNEYTPQGRQQTLFPIARPIQAGEVPADCRGAAIVHLGPLTQELEPDIIGVFNNSFVGATPQGWMRQWDTRGLVSLSDWRGAEKILPRLQAAVISIDDIQGDWTRAEKWAAQVPLLVVTQDKDGCTVLYGRQRLWIPPRPAQILDPTGAGDIFAAAFFIHYYETGELWHSAYFANVTASMALERSGAEGVPYRDEVETYIARHPHG